MPFRHRPRNNLCYLCGPVWRNTRPDYSQRWQEWPISGSTSMPATEGAMGQLTTHILDLSRELSYAGQH